MNSEALALARLPSFTPPAGALLQRKCACGSHKPGGESCTSCAAKKGGGRLPIGAANDPLEHEADRVAAQVMAGPRPDEASRAPVSVQRAAAGGGERVAEAPPSVARTLSSPGRPLEPSLRSDMEGRFGRDFSQIRVHRDGPAAASAADVGARAYTVGSTIVFGAGQYAPESAPGRQLIAHELAHSLQQGSAPRLQRSPLGGGMGGLGGGGIRGHGGTLPYREATELIKCVEIMGDEEYCREEVLGEKRPARCAATHTIPDAVHAAIGVAWGKSKHGQATVQEHGGRIVIDKKGKEQIRTGSGGGGSISLPAEKPGDVTTGTFHTHPYSISEKSHLGVAFSGGDIENFVAGDQGGVKYIGAGSCYFALDTLDYVDRDSCKKVDIKKRWNDAFAAATGTFQEKVETAVKAAIVGCGLCFYKVCRPDAASPVPKVADLVK